MLPAYVSASSETTSYGVLREQVADEVRRDEPAAAGDETRVFSGQASRELSLDRVEGPALDVALDPAEVLADEGEDEPLEAEHAEHEAREEEQAGEVRRSRSS